MLTQAMRISGHKVAKGTNINAPTLADHSLELYEFLGESYLKLDMCRGDDMDIIVKETTRYSQGCSILDAGCGPGRHVEHCSQLQSVQEVEGIDFSTTMIAAARKHTYDSPRKASVSLRVHDLLEPIIDITPFDIVLCLNNVLGNVISKDIDTATDDRKRFLQNMYTYMSPSGRIVLSVYMRSFMPPECAHGSDNGFRLLDSSNCQTGDLIIAYTPAPSLKFQYYSHWFTKEELTDLLSESGFNTLHVIERSPRLIVICQATDSRRSHVDKVSQFRASPKSELDYKGLW